ncbi:MAG: LPS export ABC transporter periplasmic protein LptC, partial [Acetobacteraceae bacterium]|nr:LPS export ABC transporter periplasmic protein LptC [Acetobacteraceae bacterium]
HLPARFPEIYRRDGDPIDILPAGRREMLAPSRERRLPSPGSLARRERLVRLAKLGLPLLSAALLALLMFWPEIEGRDGRLSFRRGPAVTPESLQVVEPRFQGVDELERPYTVTARLARQPGQEEVLLLDHPRADILLRDGAWVLIQAQAGRYDRPRAVLDLMGDVRVYHDGGTLFRTERANVLLDAGEASGDRPTEAQGPFGTIRSQGFEMRERGAVMVFTGQAHAVLEGRQQ